MWGNGWKWVQLGKLGRGLTVQSQGVTVGFWDVPYHGQNGRCFGPKIYASQVDGHEMWRPRLRGARHVELGIWCCELGSDFNQHI